MNRLLRVFHAVVLCSLVSCALAFSGCAGINSEMPPSGAAPDPLSDTPIEVLTEGFAIRKGDKLKLEFLEAPGMPREWEQVVREDGTIVLPMNLIVTAEGKTKRGLAEEIRQIYVPKYYVRMTVNIKTEERYYIVAGDVKIPGLKGHPGEITVTKAIPAAGDFTDFANKRKIEITRANGEKIKVNWNKIQDDPSKDVPIYPGDRIFVPRRLW